MTQACAERHPELRGILDAAPGADYRVRGLKLAREPHRYSGRTAMRANINVSEPRAPQDVDSPFSFSMEGYNGFDRPREEVAFAWAPGWNSPQAWNKFTDEVGGHLSAGDPGVRLLHPQPGEYDYHAALPANFTPRDSAWQVVVLPRLFGGEETSSRAAPIIERAAPATLRLSADDAQRLGCSDGDLLTVATANGTLSLPAELDAALPAGLIGVPAGVEPGLVSGDWAELSPGAAHYPAAGPAARRGDETGLGDRTGGRP